MYPTFTLDASSGPSCVFNTLTGLLRASARAVLLRRVALGIPAEVLGRAEGRWRMNWRRGAGGLGEGYGLDAASEPGGACCHVDGGVTGRGRYWGLAFLASGLLPCHRGPKHRTVAHRGRLRQQIYHRCPINNGHKASFRLAPAASLSPKGPAY